MSLKEFTLAEVAAHNTREDLYMIIRDEVYAVSKFVAEVSLINSKGKFEILTYILCVFCFSIQVNSMTRIKHNN